MAATPMRLKVYTAGRGPALLCLHGHPGSGQCMQVFTQHFSQRFFTLAPDLRGYGGSKARQDFKLTTHLEDLEALLDSYKIQDCLVLGWSLGGIFALELAWRLPQRVRGLILVATAARPWGDHPPITWPDYLLTGTASLLNLFRPGWQWNIDTFGQYSLYRHLVNQHTPATYKYLAKFALPAFLQTSPHAHRALNIAIGKGYNRVAELGKITCPVLMLAGGQDRHITAAASQETARHLPQCDWIIYDQVAHLFPWEIPSQVLADIDQWLERQFASS